MELQLSERTLEMRGLAKSVMAMEAKVDAVKANTDATQTKVDVLGTRMTVLETKITTVELKLATIESKISTMETLLGSAVRAMEAFVMQNSQHLGKCGLYVYYLHSTNLWFPRVIHNSCFLGLRKIIFE